MQLHNGSELLGDERRAAHVAEIKELLFAGEVNGVVDLTEFYARIRIEPEVFQERIAEYLMRESWAGRL